MGRKHSELKPEEKDTIQAMIDKGEGNEIIAAKFDITIESARAYRAINTMRKRGKLP